MKITASKKIILASILLAPILVFLGGHFGQAQNKAQGKPSPCTINSICECNEGDACLDCLSQPLWLRPIQIVTGGNPSLDCATPRNYQIVYDLPTATYKQSWVSKAYSDPRMGNINIGDVDNDSLKEMIALVAINGQRFIYLYEENSRGAPSFIGSLEASVSAEHDYDTCIADADNNPTNGQELIIAVGNHFEIYRWVGAGFERIWISRNYEGAIFSIDVGNCDYDVQNEVVLSMMGGRGQAIVIDYLQNNVWGNEIYTDSSGNESIDYAKVRNVDSDSLNEIVSGGNGGKLTIWKWDGFAYRIQFQTARLDAEAFTQGIEAGDIDGDGQKEVIVGTTGGGVARRNNLFIYRFNGAIYQLVYQGYVAQVTEIQIGDIDLDWKDEIVLGGIWYPPGKNAKRENGLKILDCLKSSSGTITIEKTSIFPVPGYHKVG